MFLAVAVLLLVAIALAPTLLSTSVAKARILAAAQGRVGVPVEAGRISFSWFGEQRIEGLRVGSPSGFPAGEDLLSADSVVVGKGLLGLVFSRAVAIAIDRPVLTVRRNREGVFNFERLLPGRARGPAAPGAPGGEGDGRGEGPGPPRQPRALDREVAIDVRGGRLLYRDEVLPAASDITEAEVHLAADPAGITLRAQALVTAGPEPGAAGSPGRISLSGKAQGLPSSLASLDGNAEGKAEGIRLAPYRALIEKLAGVTPPDGPVNWTFSGTVRGGAVEFASRLDAAGDLAARAEVKGSLGLAAGGREWRIDGSADLPIAAVGPAVLARVPAKVDIDRGARFRCPAFSFSGKLGEDQAALASLAGTAQVEATGPVQCSGWAVEKLTAEVRAQDGKVTIEKGEGALGGGTATVESAFLDLGAGTPAYAAVAHLEGIRTNVEMTRLLAYVVPFLALEDREAAFSGTLAGRIELSGQGFGRENLEKTLKGQGLVRVRDGTLSASRFFHQAAELIDFQLAEVAFAELGSDFAIGAGRIDASKVFITGKPGSKVRNLGLKGYTTLDRQIEFGVDLAALRETVGSKRIGRILETAKKVLGDDVLPIKLTGTLSEPKLTLELKESALPGEADLPVGEILDLFKRKKKEKK